MLLMSSLASADVQALLAEVAGRAGRYLSSLDERPVAPDGAAVAGLARFDEPLPERPGDAAATLALLDEAGSPGWATSSEDIKKSADAIIAGFRSLGLEAVGLEQVKPDLADRGERRHRMP
jgi:hypothetical protein